MSEPNEIDLDGAELLAPATADVYGKPLDFVYRAHLFTPELIRSGISVQEALLKLVADWGLKRGGVVVPLTSDSLATVATPILMRVWDAIAENYEPSPKWSGASANTSPVAESAEPAP
jgi:hypothetical protein